MSISRDAPAASVVPHALKKSLPPPKVPVPKLSAGTRRPEWPRRLYSKILLLSGLRSQQASHRARLYCARLRDRLTGRRMKEGARWRASRARPSPISTTNCIRICPPSRPCARRRSKACSRRKSLSIPPRSTPGSRCIATRSARSAGRPWSRAPGSIPPSRRGSSPTEPRRSANSVSPATRPAICRRSRTPRMCTISSSARSAPAIRSRCLVSRPPGTSRTNIALARCAIRAACSRSSASSSTTRRRSGSGTSTSERRYLVVPERPKGVEDWDEAALARLVTRNAMIGTERDLSPARAKA